MTVSPTLRAVSGLDDTPPRLRDAALVLIDYQNTYRTGVMSLGDSAAPALAAGARLLARARAAGIPIVRVVNDAGTGSPYDLDTDLGAISAEVAPRDGEPVVVKHLPDAFTGTDLHERLTALGVAPGGDLVLAGFMTHLCVTFTAQGAFARGYRPTVVAEATATRDLAAPDGTTLSAADLHRAALTTIADLFGPIAPTVDTLAD
ncbi:isochorismatase family protein [Nocardia thailandica]